jgi:hypothetical protein
MSESRYVPLERRAEWLIEKGVRAWQEIQRLAMSDEEPLDSVVLLGQELWLPHHETDGTKYHVTLRVAVLYPEQGREAAEAQVNACFREIEAREADERGGLRLAAEVRQASGPS